jgi:hypothetical protein
MDPHHITQAPQCGIGENEGGHQLTHVFNTADVEGKIRMGVGRGHVAEWILVCRPAHHRHVGIDIDGYQ